MVEIQENEDGGRESVGTAGNMETKAVTLIPASAANPAVCRIGSKSHHEHDELIAEMESAILSLEEKIRATERTPKILVERILRLEKSIRILYTWLPKERQR